YKKALGVIQKNLDRYPSIEIVLDVHRDYIVRDSGKPTELLLKPTLTEHGKNTAQIMFVVGTDALGLSHPDWKHNLAFAVQLQDTANRLHPNLCRPVNLRTERFNQHMTKGSLIVEVGASANTLAEAISAGKCVGEALASLLST
ncbi:MAG: stage II sporulation protein P, partial [Clostridia bacterium]|nr:stage II sporulation protein P [Clostridia bacterium]